MVRRDVRSFWKVSFAREAPWSSDKSDSAMLQKVAGSNSKLGQPAVRKPAVNGSEGYTAKGEVQPRGGGGVGCLLCMGRDMLQKRVLFSESVWDGVDSFCTNSGKRLKCTCLARGPCLSGKGLLSYLCLELDYHQYITVPN